MTKEIPREIVTITIHDDLELDGITLAQLSEMMSEDQGFFNIRLSGESMGYGGYAYSIVGDRLENDHEYNERVAILKKMSEDKKKLKKKREERDRAEYERLKKKFEKS